MNVLVTGIRWDCDGARPKTLPRSVLVTGLAPNTLDDASEEIAELLSDRFGFCHDAWHGETIIEAEKFQPFKADAIIHAS